MNKKINYELKNIVIVAVFTALACVGTTINIPLPTGGKIHLGNFVCILSALLCGGLAGGIVGGVGMTISDIYVGYAFDTCIRTLIVKFILGFIVGSLFRYFLKKENNYKKIFISIGIFILCVSILFTILKLNNINTINDKKFEIHILLIISEFIIGSVILLLSFVKYKSKILAFGILASAIGVIFNIVAEFVLRIVLNMTFNSIRMDESIIISISKLPSSLLTGVLTIIFIGFTFLPVLHATRNFLNNEELIENEEN